MGAMMTDETHAEADDASNAPAAAPAEGGWSCDSTQAKVATVGVIVVAAALVEVALVPGIIVGLAAAMAPKYVPQLTTAVRPAFRSIVRGAYKFGRKARAAAAEAQEQVQDIVAEVHAEGTQAGGPSQT